MTSGGVGLCRAGSLSEVGGSLSQEMSDGGEKQLSVLRKGQIEQCQEGTEEDKDLWADRLDRKH